jgi:hypothetical protein
MNLAMKQAAMRTRNGRYPDMAEGKARLAMWLLWEADPTQDLEALGQRFGRTAAWMRRWTDAGCPLVHMK